jgi:tRNA modification GTPase
MYIRDTIAAISTPIGEGGIAIIRVSGDRAKEIAGMIFIPKNSGGLKSHRFYYGDIINPVNGACLDEAMVVLMFAPKSYTAEDVLEIQCHGGYLVAQKILELVVRQGARLAEPGEFTKRAFLNGRIDLVQAEAVIDVIRGKTEAALSLAQHQREGLLSRKIEDVKAGIARTLALLEAYLDFPEEDIQFAGNNVISNLVVTALESIEALLGGYSEGKVLREGVSVLIAGKPNVGKSSLLNTLLKEKRAIVTSVPGTTRDIIEEVVSIKGLPVRMLDTAGIRETHDEIEKEGVRLALERIPRADLVLFVIDVSRPFDSEDQLLLEALADSIVLVVKNKCDLPEVLSLPTELTDKLTVNISTYTGAGIETLRERIFDTFLHGEAVDGREYVAVSQARQRDVLLRARDSLTTFKRHFSEGMNMELLVLDLRDALHAVGELTGETTPDDILDLIFQQFCIGK